MTRVTVELVGPPLLERDKTLVKNLVSLCKKIKFLIFQHNSSMTYLYDVDILEAGETPHNRYSFSLLPGIMLAHKLEGTGNIDLFGLISLVR